MPYWEEINNYKESFVGATYKNNREPIKESEYKKNDTKNFIHCHVDGDWQRDAGIADRRHG